MSDAPVYLAFESDLACIEQVAKRLFTEERLKNGDEYRDLAQKLDNALRHIRDWKVSKRTADIVIAADAQQSKEK